MIAWNILTLAYFELNFSTERSEPMLKIKIYHLQQSELIVTSVQDTRLRDHECLKILRDIVFRSEFRDTFSYKFEKFA